MGSGGPGNFDNDVACDLRQDVLGELKRDLEQDFTKFELDDVDLQMGRIAMMSGIVKACGGSAATRHEVARWRTLILGVLDQKIDGFSTPNDDESIRARRDVIQHTLDSLEQLAIRWGKFPFSHVILGGKLNQ